jgi:hypothetical protein
VAGHRARRRFRYDRVSSLGAVFAVRWFSWADIAWMWEAAQATEEAKRQATRAKPRSGRSNLRPLPADFVDNAMPR